jgi:hypothetical protein
MDGERRLISVEMYFMRRILEHRRNEIIEELQILQISECMELSGLCEKEV